MHCTMESYNTLICREGCDKAKGKCTGLNEVCISTSTNTLFYLHFSSSSLLHVEETITDRTYHFSISAVTMRLDKAFLDSSTF